MIKNMKTGNKFSAAVGMLLAILSVFGNLTVKAAATQDTVTETQIAAEPETVGETPMFEACLEYSPQGWIVKGSFKDFTPDICLIQPMCSTDGETYYDCGEKWSLQWLCPGDESELEALKNQRCLFDSQEPLKSYLAKELDCFYIKLRIVREDGAACETQAAMIDRGELKPVPADVDMAIKFADGLFIREGHPPDIQSYGKYQITIRENVTSEEISAFLPDTLPVEIQLLKGADYIGADIVDCQVKWKPLALPQLTAGENVTILDAAEELVIPAGTILHTQTGRYQIKESIDMRQQGITDEVRLVLNIVPEDGQPAGVLSEENHGLEMAFHLKPTGATSIRAYTFTEEMSEWVELSGLSLMDAVNAQPVTENSGYTVVLGREQEPYLSYWKAREAGEEPTPFFVGLKIEGGVYDGKELVLAWPDTYELPLNLPKVGGSGGNQGNAGSDDKDDSTEDGQRPGLSQKPEEESTSGLPEEPGDKSEPELPEENGGKPASGPSEESEDMQASLVKTENKLPQNEIAKDETLENGSVESHRQTEIAAAMPAEAAPQATAEFDRVDSDVEKEEKLSDGVFDTTAAMVTASSRRGEENIQPGIQEKSNRKTENTGNRVPFLITVGTAAMLVGTGIAVTHGTAVRKVVDVLRRIFLRK